MAQKKKTTTKKTSTRKPKKITSASKKSTQSKKRSSMRSSTPSTSTKRSTGTRSTSTPRSSSLKTDGITKIKVVGVGGGGGNIIGRMREKSRMRGVEYIAVNTDAQDLAHTSAHRKIYIGKALTQGLGAGMNPEIGKQAAEENRSEIGEVLKGADIVFVVGGFGGGTASGAAPVIAEISRQLGILTIGIVTKPFTFEGTQRMVIAEEALENFKEHVDALVVVPNDRVFAVISKDTPILKAFSYIDGVLHNAVQAIADLINAPGIINVDFADIRTILKNAGLSVIGVGIGSGQDRGTKAVAEAINSPLLEASIEGASGALFSIAGGRDVKMTEINDIAKAIGANLDSNARIIFGAYHDRSLTEKKIKVTVIATGFRSMGNGGSLGIPKLFATEAETREIPIGTHDTDERDLDDDTGEERDVSSKQEPWDVPAFLRKKKK